MGVGTEQAAGIKCAFCEALKRKYDKARRLTRGTSVYEEYSVKLSSVIYDGDRRSADWGTSKERFGLNVCPVCGADIKRSIGKWKGEESETGKGHHEDLARTVQGR